MATMPNLTIYRGTNEIGGSALEINQGEDTRFNDTARIFQGRRHFRLAVSLWACYIHCVSKGGV